MFVETMWAEQNAITKEVAWLSQYYFYHAINYNKVKW